MRLRWGLSERYPGGPRYRAPYGANKSGDDNENDDGIQHVSLDGCNTVVSYMVGRMIRELVGTCILSTL